MKISQIAWANPELRKKLVAIIQNEEPELTEEECEKWLDRCARATYLIFKPT